MAKLLLVDDDIELTELLAQLLALEGFHIEIANSGQQALDKLDTSYDLVLLDIMMPGLNGIETLKQIRQNHSTPVMMLTARGEEIDRVLGLELGADDYLAKPFNDRELVARIKAILRRVTLQPSPKPVEVNEAQAQAQSVDFAGLTIYPLRQQAYYQDEEVILTGTEYALLQHLIYHAGQVLSREELSLAILGKNLSPFDRSIDMHMSNLRKKLPEREDNLPWFKTLRGRGYLLIK